MPKFLKKGAYVKARYWYGIVKDVVSSEDHCLVLIFSPRGIWRGKPEEWVDSDDIVGATQEDVLKEVQIHRELLQRTLQQLQNMETQIQGESV